jgi:hypothetical protein
MPPEDLAQFLDREPFQRFRICLTDGTLFDIRHPEMVLLGRRSAVIGITNGEGPRPMYERYVNISLLHITRLEPLPTPTATGDGAGG